MCLSERQREGDRDSDRKQERENTIYYPIGKKVEKTKSTTSFKEYIPQRVYVDLMFL